MESADSGDIQRNRKRNTSGFFLTCKQRLILILPGSTEFAGFAARFTSASVCISTITSSHKRFLIFHLSVMRSLRSFSLTVTEYGGLPSSGSLPIATFVVRSTITTLSADFRSLGNTLTQTSLSANALPAPAIRAEARSIDLIMFSFVIISFL